MYRILWTGPHAPHGRWVSDHTQPRWPGMLTEFTPATWPTLAAARQWVAWMDRYPTRTPDKYQIFRSR